MIRKFEEDCFFIMPFGNKIEKVYKYIYEPLALEFKLNPIRVDQSDTGDIVHKQIFEGIQNAKIIIADISNSRPNCYLEVGYALGKEYKNKLIICCNDNHRPEKRKFSFKKWFCSQQDKIHFDLVAYNIHFWDIRKLDNFREKLKSRIQQRIELINKNKKEITDKIVSEKITKPIIKEDNIDRIFLKISKHAQEDMNK